MEAEKILFIAQEINPYVPESNLTRMGRDIPLDALERNREIRAFMPKWGNINERRNQLHEVIRLSGMNIIVNDNDHQLIIKVASIMGTRMQVYFIDNEDYFAKRLAEQDKEGNEYHDNVERAAFYARGVLETVKKLRWVPNVIHCQGWISSLVPVYLKTAYADEPCFRDCRVVFSLTDHKLTLPTGDDFSQILEYRNADASCFKEFGKNLKVDDLMKLAIKYSDGITFETKRKPKKAFTDYATAGNKLIMEKRNGSPADFMEFFDAVWSRDRQVPIED